MGIFTSKTEVQEVKPEVKTDIEFKKVESTKTAPVAEVDSDPRYENASKEQIEALWAEFGAMPVKALRNHKLTISQIRKALSK